MADAMICFVVFAIKYVLFAILHVVPMSDGHWTSWPHISTMRLVSNKKIAFTHTGKQEIFFSWDIRSYF